VKNIKFLTLFWVSWVVVLPFDSTCGAQGKSKATNQDSAIYNYLRELGAKSSKVKSLETSFIQEKKLAAFKNKLVIKGMIYLLKPDKIAWHVDDPIKYSLLITGKFLRQWNEETDRIQEIPFAQNPMLKTVFDYLKGWFSGNYVIFLKDYDVKILQKVPPLIEFIPKEKSVVKQIIRNITMCLKEDVRYLKWIKIKNVNGDNTKISFKNTLLNSPIDTALFEVKRDA
jgi:outer membrane lipoprotein-sorting protein